MTEITKSKILCVEDEQDIRENIVAILQDEGFEVYEAEDGKKGFESFLQHRPDLIISDIMMPELDGYGLLELVRNHKNTRNTNVPFIFLTALAQKDDIIKGVGLSANDYLIKPVDFDLMIAKINEKISNAKKIKDLHHRDIKNIKNQVAQILPAEITSYLDIITQMSGHLKEQPYGPFPHRRYSEDLEKIYFNAMKLKAAVANSLDEHVIERRINVNEEIFIITDFINDFISGLSHKLQERIIFERPFEAEKFPKLKADRLVIFEALRKILAGMLRSDLNASVKITVMLDHLDRMAIIFYLVSERHNIDFTNNLEESQISRILDKQNCRFEICSTKEGGRENSTILIIPNYRLIK